MAWIDATKQFTRNPKWEYEKNKTIEGLLVNKSLDMTPKKLCFYDIEVAGDKTYSVLGTTMIDRVLRDMPIGTKVRLEYTGLAKSKSGSDYKTFNIQYDTDSVPPDDIEEFAKKLFK